jgi:transposase
MPTPPFQIVAVDVSKDSLQIKTDSDSFAVAATPEGLAKLLKFIQKLQHPLVVCEATGGYERHLINQLHKAKIASRVLNPARIRAFAESEGIKAKTDPIDAEMIRRFAIQKEVQPAPEPTELQQELTALMDRRSQITGEIAREKNRLQKACKVIANSIKRTLKFAEAELKRLEKSIREKIASDSALTHYAKAMQSVSGVGEVTAWTILTYLSEITEMGRNQLIAMAGVAPYNRDSGKKSGKRSIRGGRPKVRRALFMAAHTAAFSNAVIKPYVQGLMGRGKPYKCAIVAAMRKLLLHLQSLLKKARISLAS